MAGKIVGTKIYIHRNFIYELDEKYTHHWDIAWDKGWLDGNLEWNILKVDKNEPYKFSFLQYQNFWADPHPALQSSIVVNVHRLDRIRLIKYSQFDPYILHRKELLIGCEHPLRKLWGQLSCDEQLAGLLNRPRIGKRRYWESLLEREGLGIVGHKLRWLT